MDALPPPSDAGAPRPRLCGRQRAHSRPPPACSGVKAFNQTPVAYRISRPSARAGSPAGAPTNHPRTGPRPESRLLPPPGGSPDSPAMSRPDKRPPCAATHRGEHILQGDPRSPAPGGPPEPFLPPPGVSPAVDPPPELDRPRQRKRPPRQRRRRPKPVFVTRRCSMRPRRSRAPANRTTKAGRRPA